MSQLPPMQFVTMSSDQFQTFAEHVLAELAEIKRSVCSSQTAEHLMAKVVKDMTLEEVATALDCSRSNVYKLRDMGKLKVSGSGRKQYVTSADFRAHVEKYKMTPQ